MTAEEAYKIINEVYPKPVSNPEYINPEIDEALDLSIVIPVYNYADILEKNIESILNQKTNYKFEAIFVDDGSTDGAQDILRKYENYPNVKLIFQQNGGIGAARNTGINNADGKYLMFVDCDDIVHDDIVETLMSKAYADNLDMVVAAHNLVKEKNGEVYEVVPNIYPQKNLIGYRNGDEIMNLPGLPWAKVYKRELWNNVRFFPGYWYEDDIIQFLIFPQVKSYAYIPKVVYEYKWYEKNFSHTQNDSKRVKCIDSYWILTDILDVYIKFGLPNDSVIYTLLIRHLSAYYYPFIKDLDDKVVEALYVAAREMLSKYQNGKTNRLPYVLKKAEYALENDDIELWKLSSFYQ
ncbi:MAG: glycosyltransferase [Ruminococcus sp.]|nr:glycosyltransferase [Ruminococcus sp.]